MNGLIDYYYYYYNKWILNNWLLWGKKRKRKKNIERKEKFAWQKCKSKRTVMINIISWNMRCWMVRLRAIADYNNLQFGKDKEISSRLLCVCVYLECNCYVRIWKIPTEFRVEICKQTISTGNKLNKLKIDFIHLSRSLFQFEITNVWPLECVQRSMPCNWLHTPFSVASWW